MKAYEQRLAGSFDGVLHEAQALYEGRGALKETFDRLSSRLGPLGIAFSLVGGYALILHGVRRFTEDIDILIRPEDLARLRDNLVGRGYVTIQGNQKSLRDAQTGVRIDFVICGPFPGDGKPKAIAFPDPYEKSEIRDHVRVVDLPTLIELKLASGMTARDRLQDLADVQKLIQVHRLGDDFADGLHPYVREKFAELAKDAS